MSEQGMNGWSKLGIGLGLGLLLGLMLAPQSPPNPALRTLDANLWVQTSGEFRALCLQTYRFAFERLAKRLAESPKGDKPAVVMDLDETVFDNSPYQTWLYKAGVAHLSDYWKPWEMEHAKGVLAVPGAVEFIQKAENAGAEVHYISNRTVESKEPTTAALANLGISTKGIEERLHLMVGKESDKTKRRAAVAKGRTVVMWVGDSLTDFDQEFKGDKPAKGADPREAIKNRNLLVAKHKAKWGGEWIILPNPAYGDWARMAGDDPLQVLNPAFR